MRSLAIPGLLSSEDFERALQIERARSDRTGPPFLVLVFTVLHPEAREESPDGRMPILAQVVRERCRLSDIPGWYGPGNKQVGLIVSATPSQAAASLIQAIEDIFHQRLRRHIPPDQPLPELSCEIFEYPSERRDQNPSRASQPERYDDSSLEPPDSPGLPAASLSRLDHHRQPDE